MSAAIHTLSGFSVYASQSQFVGWTKSFSKSRSKLSLIQSETDAKAAL
jgi:hypothetical protein